MRKFRGRKQEKCFCNTKDPILRALTLRTTWNVGAIFA